MLKYLQSQKTLLTTVFFILSMHSSFSYANNTTTATKANTKTSISLGLGAAYIPKYTGADKYETRALPIVHIKYGRLTVGGINGISYDFLADDTLKAGMSVGYFKGRDESDAIELAGLGDIDSAMTVSGYIRKSFGDFHVSSNVQRDFSDDVGGIKTNISAGYATQVLPKVRLSSNVTLSWINEDYAQSVFGINQAQAAESGLPLTLMEAGLESATLSFTGMYFINRQLTLSCSLSISEYTSDISASPIVLEKQPYRVITGISYRF